MEKMRMFSSKTNKEGLMEKKFFIRGYRSQSELPTLSDNEIYTLPEAVIKAKEYFGRIGALRKIKIFEQGTDERRAPTITLMH